MEGKGRGMWESALEEEKCGTKHLGNTEKQKKCRRKRKYENVEQDTIKRTIVNWLGNVGRTAKLMRDERLLATQDAVGGVPK